MRWWDQVSVFVLAFRQSWSWRMALEATWIARGFFAFLWVYQRDDRRPTLHVTSIVMRDFVQWLEAHQYEPAFFRSPARYLHLYFQTQDWEAPLCPSRQPSSTSSSSD